MMRRAKTGLFVLGGAVVVSVLMAWVELSKVEEVL